MQPTAAPDPRRVSFAAAPGTHAGATTFRCALCGLRFTHGALTCGSCPLARGCAVVSCPRCGHSFPRRSRLFDTLRRWFGRDPESSR